MFTISKISAQDMVNLSIHQAFDMYDDLWGEIDMINSRDKINKEILNRPLDFITLIINKINYNSIDYKRNWSVVKLRHPIHNPIITLQHRHQVYSIYIDRDYRIVEWGEILDCIYEYLDFL